MNNRHKILLLLFCQLAVFLRSQDIHFSQYNGSLLNISPAFTGFFDGDYRVGAIFRSQWYTVPVKYNTFSMHGETRLQPRQLEKDHIGLGFVFNSDRAGDTRYGTTQLYGSGNYMFMAKADSSLILTLGLNMGWGQVGFDYSRMTFENQFDGYAYNRALSAGEQFSWMQRNFFDMTIGSGIRYYLNRKHLFTYGVGFHHVTSPRISYQGNDVSRLDYRLSNYLAYSTPVAQNSDIIAEALFTTQGKNYELIPHVSLKYHINREEQKAISGGICLRTRDAVVLRMGYFHKTLQSGIAYDINISRFTPATNRQGGFEIFVNYVFRLKPSFIARKRACPVFM